MADTDVVTASTVVTVRTAEVLAGATTIVDDGELVAKCLYKGTGQW